KHDGGALADLVGPQGLYLAWDSGNSSDRVTHLSVDEVRQFFKDDTPRDWGPNYGGPPDRIVDLASGITGLLAKDLLSGDVNLACNDNQDRKDDTSVLSEIWLEGYKIVNFYSVKTNAPDWGAWGIGIIYWNDKPQIIALTHYEYTP